MKKTADKRTSQRIQIEVPVHLADAHGVTRDISGSGIFFVTDHSFTLGEGITFSLDLDYAYPGHQLRLDCHGKINRIERVGNQNGIAAELDRISSLH